MKMDGGGRGWGALRKCGEDVPVLFLDSIMVFFSPSFRAFSVVCCNRGGSILL